MSQAKTRTQSAKRTVPSSSRALSDRSPRFISREPAQKRNFFQRLIAKITGSGSEIPLEVAFSRYAMPVVNESAAVKRTLPSTGDVDIDLLGFSGSQFRSVVRPQLARPVEPVTESQLAPQTPALEESLVRPARPSRQVLVNGLMMDAGKAPVLAPRAGYAQEVAERNARAQEAAVREAETVIDLAAAEIALELVGSGAGISRGGQSPISRVIPELVSSAARTSSGRGLEFNSLS